MKWRVSYIVNKRQYTFRNISTDAAQALFTIILLTTGSTFVSKMREVV